MAGKSKDSKTHKEAIISIAKKEAEKTAKELESFQKSLMDSPAIKEFMEPHAIKGFEQFKSPFSKQFDTYKPPEPDPKLMTLAIPLRLSASTIEEMDKHQLHLLLSGDHPHYDGRHLSPDTRTLVKQRLQEIEAKKLDKRLEEITLLAKKPHWMNWINLFIGISVAIMTALSLYLVFTSSGPKSQLNSGPVVPVVKQPPQKAVEPDVPDMKPAQQDPKQRASQSQHGDKPAQGLQGSQHNLKPKDKN